MWQRIDNIVAEVLLNDQMSVIQALEGYSYIENFFQLLRFDFMLDDKVCFCTLFAYKKMVETKQ